MPGDAVSGSPMISPSGAVVAFYSEASNLSGMPGQAIYLAPNPLAP